MQIFCFWQLLGFIKTVEYIILKYNNGLNKPENVLIIKCLLNFLIGFEQF